MTTKTTKKYGVRLTKPADIKRIIQRVISEIFREESQVENAGKLNQLCQTWLKAHRMEWEHGEFAEIHRQLNELKMEANGRHRRW
jgi:hemerythrin